VTRSLEQVARRVNWYDDPADVLANVDQFLCEVMARGRIEDILAVRQRFSWEDFRKAYLAAPAGLFAPRAWAYWGLMLLDEPERPMPQRFPGAGTFDWRHRR
jgi:hypothetical protein